MPCPRRIRRELASSAEHQALTRQITSPLARRLCHPEANRPGSLKDLNVTHYSQGSHVHTELEGTAKIARS
jgi:hypothetical protein